jgi:hypothetical protein
MVNHAGKNLPKASRRQATRASKKGDRFREVLAIAEETGLFRGTRSRVVRGRMPEALVEKAKSRTGIESDTELLEVALAHLALADDYPEWLLSRKGTVPVEIELDF